MPKRNYGYEKRQKELAKARKREAKQQRRAERAGSDPSERTDPAVQESDPGTAPPLD